MTDLFGPVIELGKCLLPPAIRHVRYFLCLNKAVEDLRCKTNYLYTEDTEFFAKAEALIEEADRNQDRLHGWRPNFKLRFRLCMGVADLNKRFSKLDDNSNFRPPPPGTDSDSCGNFTRFESTKKAYTELMEVLNKDGNSKIGLYGMGGCGKTTLVEEVCREQEKLAKKVVFVVVSNRDATDVRKIQGIIAGQVKFPLKDEDDIKLRAGRLLERLKVWIKKTLIILDDVWEAFNLKDIGIPEDCNILLTTRSRDVCRRMRCTRIIHLELLTEPEAWTLFREHASVPPETPEHQAREIAGKCAGLPVAIVAVAKTLDGKQAFEWKNALQTLKKHKALDIPKDLVDPHKCLRLSYSQLEGEVQIIFKLCSLFPEDSEIRLEILTRFAFGLNLLREEESLDDCRTKVFTVIQTLTDSSLLLRVQGAERRFVKMHDLVRDVCLSIAKEEKKESIVIGKDLRRLAKHSTKKYITRLYCHKLEEISGKLDCPQLEILFLDWEGDCSPKLADAFFEKTKKLTVFSVRSKKYVFQTSTLLLPQSTHLKNLGTLRLEGCKLDDSSFLKNLSRLGTLELRECTLTEVPKEISELKNLTLLDVSHCRIEGGGNPYEVLGRCLELEELYFYENDVSMLKLKDEDLAGVFGKTDRSSRDDKLKRYHLQIGSRIDRLQDDLTLTPTFLSICQNRLDSLALNAKIKNLVGRAQVLLLSQIQEGCKTIIPDMVHKEEGMNELTELLLLNSEAIKFLIDSTSTNPAFSKLAKVRIEDMKHLEALNWGTQLPSNLFIELKELIVKKCSQLHSMLFSANLNLGCLKVLILENCPKLTSLFGTSVARSLIMLEELKITECNGLSQLITNDEGEIQAGDNDPKSYFKKLKELVIGSCGQLTYLIPVSFALGLLELRRLDIVDAPHLTYIFGPDNENEAQSIGLPALKLLQLVNLQSVIGICPDKHHVLWELSSIDVSCSNCPKLTTPGLEQVIQQSDLTPEMAEEAEMLQETITTTTNNIQLARTKTNKIQLARTKTMKAKNQRSELKQKARLYSLLANKYNSLGDFIFFRNTKLAYDELLERLDDDEVSMIGLYGVEGCGKTTLAKQLAKAANALFNTVGFVVLSYPIDVRKIQDDIARQLELKLEEEELAERAGRLFERLTNGERILLILDNVWEKLDLETMGIPLGHYQKGCIVLFTTPHRHLCTLMNCQKTVALALLTQEEAFILFQKHAGITNDISDDLKVLVLEITEECKGLPVAIVAVARSLKGKSLLTWKMALKTLRSNEEWM